MAEPGLLQLPMKAPFVLGAPESSGVTLEAAGGGGADLAPS